MNLEIQVADPSDLYSVWKLNYDAYTSAGYISPNLQRTWSEYGWLELGQCPATTVLLAMMGDTLVGSVSVTKDGPLGLHTDVDFPEETRAVRREGGRLASSWRIITSCSERTNCMIVASLMRSVAQFAVEWGIDTVLCTFNPKHEKVYQRLFHAKTIARRDGTRGLCGAPAVLMRFEAAECPKRWLR